MQCVGVAEGITICDLNECHAFDMGVEEFVVDACCKSLMRMVASAIVAAHVGGRHIVSAARFRHKCDRFAVMMTGVIQAHDQWCDEVSGYCERV